MTQQLQTIIDTAWEQRAEINASSASAEVRDAVTHVIAGLDNGSLRVAQKEAGGWTVNQWIKKAVLLSFRLENNVPVSGGDIQFYDKVPTKFADYTPEDFAKGGFRVVPPAVARRGSFIGKNVVLMPSYVNIGAYVDEGTMVDTWATVGSCAQIGKNVHLSGGVGIGGVLEPMQANPT
ncbi:MAG: 2,3,4,5-tetrahydropyridine-2,6-dicarboxylate N-succinyltransferase, partial [Telluria sp.]